MTTLATPARLSPLNFSGLIALANTPLYERPEDHPARKALDGRQPKRSAIECWKCPDCAEVYDDEDEAVECCRDDDHLHTLHDQDEAVECCRDDDHLHTLHDQDGVSLCPICASSNTDARQASDCCLWKDLDAPTRWAMADQVEAGASWVDLLQINRKDITQ
jgi:hypothetical protein